MNKVTKLNPKIELAVPDDAEVICSIRDEAWLDGYPNEALGITKENVRINAQGLNGEFVPRRIAWFKEKITNKSDSWVVYVCKIDGKVRGFAVASVDDKGRKFLNSIYVKPDFQGKGLGKKLMKQALDWLGNDGDVYLEAARHNEGAIRFYEQWGFEKTNNKVEEESDRPSYITPIPQIEMVLRAKPIVA